MANRLLSPVVVVLLLPSLSMLYPLPKLLADEPVEVEPSPGLWLVGLAAQEGMRVTEQAIKTAVKLVLIAPGYSRGKSFYFTLKK